MATWTLVYYRSRGRVSGTGSAQSNVEIAGELISSQIITVGTTVVVVPKGTQLIEIIPSLTDGNGFFWISPIEDAVDVDATHNRPVYGSGTQPSPLEWRNNYEFQHLATLP